MSKLRDDIRTYEAKKGKKVSCSGSIKCLSCPISHLGCPMARKFMK